MPFPVIRFAYSTSKSARIAMLVQLRLWMDNENLSPAKKDSLQCIIRFAEQRFTHFSWKITSQSRLLACENIFKLADQPDTIFFQGMIRELQNITDATSELRAVLMRLVKYYMLAANNGTNAAVTNRVTTEVHANRAVEAVNYRPNINPSLERSNLEMYYSENMSRVVSNMPSLNRESVQSTLFTHNREVSSVGLARIHAHRNIQPAREPFDDLVEKMTRIFAFSADILKHFFDHLVPESLPMPERIMLDDDYLDLVIADFQTETKRLQSRDLYLGFLLISTLLVLGNVIECSQLIENRWLQLITTLAVCLYIKLALSPNRNQLSTSQGAKLLFLLNAYQHSIRSSPNGFENPKANQLFEVLAPYVSEKQLLSLTDNDVVLGDKRDPKTNGVYCDQFTRAISNRFKQHFYGLSVSCLNSAKSNSLISAELISLRPQHFRR
jgi:hypothetical protein